MERVLSLFLQLEISPLHLNEADDPFFFQKISKMSADMRSKYSQSSLKPARAALRDIMVSHWPPKMHVPFVFIDGVFCSFPDVVSCKYLKRLCAVVFCRFAGAVCASLESAFDPFQTIHSQFIVELGARDMTACTVYGRPHITDIV